MPEVSSGGEPPLEGPANSNSGHPQGPTPDEDLPSSTPPEVSPDSLHLSHLSGNLIKTLGKQSAATNILCFLVAWWFFLFSAFATYVLIRVGAHIFTGSGDVGGVQRRTLADWLAIEEHANQLAARLADQEEANARLTIWTMELECAIRDELDQSHNAQVQALQEEKEELLTRSNTYRERIVEMETAMKELTTSSQKLEEELVARDRELAGLRDMFSSLKSFELSLSQTNADAASLGAATPPNVPKEDGARRKLSASSGGSAQDAADGSDWGAEVDELANEVDLDDQLAVTEMTSSRESDRNGTRGRQNERLQQVLANFLDVGKLKSSPLCLGGSVESGDGSMQTGDGTAQSATGKVGCSRRS
ncbi:lipoprotein transporter activity [Sparganum proliferum]